MFILKLLFKLTWLRGKGITTVTAMTELVADLRISELQPFKHDPVMSSSERKKRQNTEKI